MKSTDKIRILHLTTDCRISGAEKLLLGVADKYDSSRFHLEFCTLTKEGELHREIEKRELNALSLSISRPRQFITGFFRLVKLLKSRKVDLLHTHLFHASVIGQVAARLAGTPRTVMTRHYLNYIDLFRGPIDKMLDNLSLRLSHKIIAVSENVRQTLVKHNLVNPNKIIVVHNGIDTSEIKEMPNEIIQKNRQELGLAGYFVIGQIGNLHPCKGHRYLLQAIAKLNAEGSKIKLLIVGEGPLKKELVDLSKQLAVEENVLFLSYRKDVYDLMALMDVIVQPSIDEGFGISVIEAMAMQKPVVGTTVGGIPEIIEHNLNGILVPPADSESLQKAIAGLIEDAQLRKRLGEMGKKTVEQKFTIAAMAKKYEQLYANDCK